MEQIRLESGREIAIRAIRPDDGAGLQAAYERLSPKSKYQRFLVAKPRLTPQELRYLTDVDGANHVALIATPAEDPNFILAVGRYVRLPTDSRAAELAIAVGDAFQREGIAAELLERLADAAAAHGIERFAATMLADNVPAHRLLSHLANDAATEHLGAVDEVEIELAA
jgi:RimJ/RimL family protein N-acetyltransferase